MRRILSLVLFAALALSLAACSGSGKKSTAGSEAEPAGSQEAEAANSGENDPEEYAPAYFGEHEMNTFDNAGIAAWYPSPKSAASGAVTDEILMQVFAAAEGSAACGGPEHYALQKKTDGKWTTVFDATGDDASVELPYGKPVEYTIDLGDLLTKNGDGRYRIIKRLVVDGAVGYSFHEFSVLKQAVPANYKKSVYVVDPREELRLTASYPSAGAGDPSWPGSVDITLELLKDTGIDPVAGNAADCIIEEEIDGVWYTVPAPYNDHFAITAEGYVPMVGRPVKQTFSLLGLVQHPGHFRVLKSVIIGRGTAIVHEYYAAEFDVPER